MKGIFLSVVVICALVVAGVGGTLANYIDTEEEIGDELQASSMDLKIKYLDGDYEDDEDVDAFTLKYLKPDQWKDVTKTLKNWGTLDGDLYIQIKNINAYEDNDKDLDGDGNIEATSDDMPEPEYVAQNGGKVGQEMVAGLGPTYDFSEHVEVQIWFDADGDGFDAGDLIDLSEYDEELGNDDGKVKLNELESTTPDVLNDYQIYIGVLPACSPRDIKFEFKIQNRLDGTYIGQTGDPAAWKFRHWPTNAYMGDRVTFDVLYELWGDP
jgi:hypothetical protein